MQIEQSIIFDGYQLQELSDISKCLSAIPDLLNVNLSLLNISQLTFSSNLISKNKSNTNFDNLPNSTEQQNSLEMLIKKQFFPEGKLQDDFHFEIRMQFQHLNLSSAVNLIQTDKFKEIINCSRNSQIGIQFKKSDGLLSNQIFNSKIQSVSLTTPLSARNSIYLGQSIIQQSNDCINEQQNQKNKYKWNHQVPYAHNNQVNRHLNQDYSLQRHNPFQDSKQTKKNILIIRQSNQKVKQEGRDISKVQSQNLQQSNISSKNTGFKLLTKQQKVQINNNKLKEGHVVVTLPQTKKKFDSFSQQQRKPSKSLDQININQHFQRLLQNSSPRQLYSKPFFYSQYSQISNINNQPSSENYIQNLYKPVKRYKQKQKTLDQNQNNSYDQPSQQFYSDDSFEGKPQNIKKIDLLQIKQDRDAHLLKSKEQSNLNLEQSITNQNSEGNIKNSYQESPSYNSQNYQMALQSTLIQQGDNHLEDQSKYFNYQEYSNFQYFQDNQIESEIKQNPFSTKKPIQIKLNIKQFITSEQKVDDQKNSPISFNLLQSQNNLFKTHH